MVTTDLILQGPHVDIIQVWFVLGFLFVIDELT